MAKALGLRPRPAGRVEQADRRVGQRRRHRRRSRDHDIPRAVLELAAEIEDAPRHLGIHSGGMVICDRPVIEVCPVEWARMDKRSVLQWDKDDCAAAGLVKFDLLGLGMLSRAALRRRPHPRAPRLRGRPGHHPAGGRRLRDAVPRRHRGRVPDRVARADGHAAAAEAAPLLRPGGRGRARSGPAPSRAARCTRTSAAATARSRSPTCTRCSRTALGKTLGVPLFQEQLMQMAIDVAGFTPAEADQLRQAMGSKRSRARMERLKERLYEGMAERGITGDVADEIFDEDGGVRQLRLPRDRTRCRSPTSSTRRRGSSSTSRPRSARRC